MTSRGDRLTAAIKKALATGKVDENGRPLAEYITRQVLGLPLTALTEGDRQALDEIIDRWMRRNRV